MGPKSPDVRTPESIVTKAVAQEAKVSKKTSKANTETVADVREKLRDQKWLEGLKILRTPPVEQKKISDKLAEFGTTRDPDTGKKAPTAAEQTRRTDAENATKFAKKFIESGYDKMDSTTGGEQEQLRNKVLDAARLRSPSFAQEIDGMDDDQRKAFAERYLRDPAFSKEARQVFVDLLNPEKKFTDPSVSKAAERKANLEFSRVTAEKTELDRLWDMNDSQLQAYESRSSSTPGQPPIVGAELQRSESLKTEIKGTRTSLEIKRNTLAAASSSVLTLQSELSNAQILANSKSTLVIAGGMGGRDLKVIQSEYNSALQAEAAAKAQVTQEEGTLKVKEGDVALINQEYQALSGRRKELAAQRRDLDVKLGNAESEVEDQRRNVYDAETMRVGEETALVEGFENVFSEAANRVLDSDVEKANGIYNTRLEDQKIKTNDNNEKAMLEALQVEMLGPEMTRKKGVMGFRKEQKYRPISKQKVSKYNAELMAKGPNEVMKKLLLSRTNLATGANYTDAEAASILANKDYVAKMQPEVIVQILGRKMMTGGIPQEDVHIIMNSQWGKDMLDKARDSNAAYRNAVASDMGPGALNNPNFKEKFAEKIRKHPIWFSLLLGIPFLAGSAVGANMLEDIGK